MKVSVRAGRNEGQVVAFIEGMVAFFPRSFQAEVGSEISVMITGVNPTHKVLFIEPVDLSKHMLIKHIGFECSGSMCCTTSCSADVNGILTPGRTGVYEANNVNCCFGPIGEPEYIKYARKPGQVWVLRTDVANSGITRKVKAVGLESVQEMAFWVEKHDLEYTQTRLKRKAKYDRTSDTSEVA